MKINHRPKKLIEHQVGNTTKFTLRHIIIKLQKTKYKDKILKKARGKTMSYL